MTQKSKLLSDGQPPAPVLQPGAQLPGCTALSCHGVQVALRDCLTAPLTALYFLRDYACVLTQYELALLTEDYQLFTRTGMQAVAVVETTPETFCHDWGGKPLPFTVLCDATAQLYARFGVGTAASMETLGNDATAARIAQAKQAGFCHGLHDVGSPLRLPAVFLADASGTLQFCHYGKTGEDLPSVPLLADVGQRLLAAKDLSHPHSSATEQ